MNLTDKMASGYETLKSSAVRIWQQVTKCAAQWSQLLSMSSMDTQRGLRYSENWALYMLSIRASWVPLHDCSCYDEHMGMLLQSLRAHCCTLGGPGNNWKCMTALVMSTGVGVRMECSFSTDLHFADVFMYPVKIVLHGYFQIFTVHRGTSSIIGPPGL